MPGLIVKEEIRFEFLEKIALVETAKEHGLINLDVPVNQGTNRPFMSRSRTCCHQGRPNAHALMIPRFLLQLMQRLQKRLEWTWWQGRVCLPDFMSDKGIKTLALIDTLGFITEQHRIAIERYPQFIGKVFNRFGRMRIHMCSGITCLKRLLDVTSVGREKKVRSQRLEITIR